MKPIKAWQLIFTNTILEKIVKYTNNYGQLNGGANKWSPVDWKDITNFFCVLFVAGIQKRKDKPSNWFSKDKIFESTVAKKIMTGDKFGKILRYLHCWDPTVNGGNSSGEYDPSYK